MTSVNTMEQRNTIGSGDPAVNDRSTQPLRIVIARRHLSRSTWVCAITTITLLLITACTPPQKPTTESKTEIQAIHREVIGLRAELDELRQIVLELDEQVDQFVLHQRLSQADLGVDILSPPAPPPQVVETPPEPQQETLPPDPPADPIGPPRCSFTLEIRTTSGEVDSLADVARRRLEALDVAEINIVPDTTQQRIHAAFLAPLSEGPTVVRWIETNDLLTVAWVSPDGLKGVDLDAKLTDFSKLYPTERAALKISDAENGLQVDGVNAQEISQFADQMLGELLGSGNKSTTIERYLSPEPSSIQRYRWRVIALENPPLLTADALETAEAPDDEDTPTLRLRLTPDAKLTLATATKAHDGRKLAFLIGGELIYTTTILAPVTNGVIELTLDDTRIDTIPAQQRIRQLSRLLNSGRYLSEITDVEITDVQCPKSP